MNSFVTIYYKIKELLFFNGEFALISEIEGYLLLGNEGDSLNTLFIMDFY